MAKGKNGGKSMGGCVKTNRAPTMQGMQQVDTWNLMQIVPVTIDTSVYDSDQPATVQFVGGVNRWLWELR